MQKNNNLHSFDAVMNEQFGVPGTPEREAFNRDAENYCIGQIILEARKREKATQEALAKKIGTNKSYISKIDCKLVEELKSRAEEYNAYDALTILNIYCFNNY